MPLFTLSYGSQTMDPGPEALASSGNLSKCKFSCPSLDLLDQSGGRGLATICVLTSPLNDTNNVHQSLRTTYLGQLLVFSL